MRHRSLRAPLLLPRLPKPAMLTRVVLAFVVSSHIGVAGGKAAPASWKRPEVASLSAEPEPVWGHYSITEIPLRYSLSTDRLSINESGDVVGTYQNHENKRRDDCAFYYHNGIIRDIKSSEDDRTVAVGINNRGEILLYRRSLQGHDAPFIWTDGQFTSVGPIPKEFSTWDRGTKSRVPVGDCRVCAINESGDVAGFLEEGELPPDSVPHTRPFRWHDGSVTVLTESNFAADKANDALVHSYLKFQENGVYNFQAQAMNDSGDIVGDTPGGGFAPSSLAVVLWKAGHGQAIHAFGEHSSVDTNSKSSFGVGDLPDMIRPCALNNQDEWVGNRIRFGTSRLREAYPFGVLGEQACVWTTQKNAVEDLAERFSNLQDDPSAPRTPIGSEAFGINDSGQIVGKSMVLLAILRTRGN